MINIQETARLAHERAMLAGWWDHNRSMTHVFFLVKGELHEAAEALRIGKHAPMLTVELLDIISRKLDKLSLNFERVGLAMQYTLSDIFCYLYGIAKKMNFNLDLHIIAKMDYNQTRGIRHGKKF